jgi:hypothetical protein
LLMVAAPKSSMAYLLPAISEAPSGDLYQPQHLLANAGLRWWKRLLGW